MELFLQLIWFLNFHFLKIHFWYYFPVDKFLIHLSSSFHQQPILWNFNFLCFLKFPSLYLNFLLCLILIILKFNLVKLIFNHLLPMAPMWALLRLQVLQVLLLAQMSILLRLEVRSKMFNLHFQIFPQFIVKNYLILFQYYSAPQYSQSLPYLLSFNGVYSKTQAQTDLFSFNTNRNPPHDYLLVFTFFSL